MSTSPVQAEPLSRSCSEALNDVVSAPTYRGWIVLTPSAVRLVKTIRASRRAAALTSQPERKLPAAPRCMALSWAASTAMTPAVCASASTVVARAPEGLGSAVVVSSGDERVTAMTRPVVATRAINATATHRRDRPGRGGGSPGTSDGSVTASSYGWAGCRPALGRSADLGT